MTRVANSVWLTSPPDSKLNKVQAASFLIECIGSDIRFIILETILASNNSWWSKDCVVCVDRVKRYLHSLYFVHIIKIERFVLMSFKIHFPIRLKLDNRSITSKFNSWEIKYRLVILYVLYIIKGNILKLIWSTSCK